MGVVVDSIGTISGTGTFTVTGLPFQPVAVLFWNQIGALEPPGMMLGCATSSSDQWVIWTGADSQTSGYTIKYNEGRTDACIFNKAAPYNTVAYQASFVGFTSDGFQCNVTTFNAGGEDMVYMAIGGNNIGSAFAGTFTTGGSTGTEAVTGVGFEPKALIVAHQLSTFDSGRLANMKWGVGVTDGTNQYSSYGGAQPASDHAHMHRTDSVACGILSAGAFRMELDTFDSDGFTVDVTDASSGDHDFAYLAIDAAAAAAGNDLMPDSISTQDLTTPGFRAQGVFFTWNGVDVPSTSGVLANGTKTRPGVGAATLGVNSAVSLIARDTFPFGVYTTDGYQDTAAISVRGQGDGISGTSNDILHAAIWDSSTQGTLTLDWTHITAGLDRAYGWLALPGDLPFTWVPSIYRRVV